MKDTDNLNLLKELFMYSELNGLTDRQIIVLIFQEYTRMQIMLELQSKDKSNA